MTEYKATPPTPDHGKRRGRKPRGERALTGAERQARYRQRQAEQRDGLLRRQEDISFQEQLDVLTAAEERLPRERGPRAAEAPRSTVAPEAQAPSRQRPPDDSDDPYAPDVIYTFNEDMSVRRVAPAAAELNRKIEKLIRDPRLKADEPYLIEMARLLASDIKLTRWGVAAIVSKGLKGSSLYAHTRRLYRKFKEAETQVPAPAWVFQRIGPEGVSFFELVLRVSWSRETPPPKN